MLTNESQDNEAIEVALIQVSMDSYVYRYVKRDRTYLQRKIWHRLSM